MLLLVLSHLPILNVSTKSLPFWATTEPYCLLYRIAKK